MNSTWRPRFDFSLASRPLAPALKSLDAVAPTATASTLQFGIPDDGPRPRCPFIRK
jgi:hypothetical protein